MRSTLTVFGSLSVIVLMVAAAMHCCVGGTASASTATATASAATPKTYSIDPVHSSLVFGIRHLNVANFYGRFNGMRGTIAWDEESPDNSSIEIEVQASKVDTGNQGRDDHLRSPDFFNAAEFPTITFKSTKIEKQGDSFRVTGNLTMHGVERPITLDLNKTGSTTHPRSGKEIIGLETHFTVKRSEHRMNYGIEQNALGDEVKLIVAIEAAAE